MSQEGVFRLIVFLPVIFVDGFLILLLPLEFFFVSSAELCALADVGAYFREDCCQQYEDAEEDKDDEPDTKPTVHVGEPVQRVEDGDLLRGFGAVGHGVTPVHETEVCVCSITEDRSDNAGDDADDPREIGESVVIASELVEKSHKGPFLLVLVRLLGRISARNPAGFSFSQRFCAVTTHTSSLPAT